MTTSTVSAQYMVCNTPDSSVAQGYEIAAVGLTYFAYQNEKIGVANGKYKRK